MGGKNKNPARLLPREFCAGSLLTNRSSTRAEHLCCAGTRCGLSVVTSINSRGSVFTGGITGLRGAGTSGTDLRVYTCGVSIALRRGSGGGGAAFYLSYRSAINSPVTRIARTIAVRLRSLYLFARAPAWWRSFMDLVFIRLFFIALLAVACALLQPFGLEKFPAGGVGAFIGAAVVAFEMRLRVVSLKRLIGAVIGSITGIFGAYLF